MDIIYVGQRDITLRRRSLFLAGPSPREKRHYNWRPRALKILRDMRFNGVVFVPLTEHWDWLGNYDAQCDWELDHLEIARAIAFWVPRNLVSLPGYTTNVEYGLFADSGKSILGYPKRAPKMRYLRHLAKRKNIPVYHTLSETLTAAVQLCQ